MSKITRLSKRLSVSKKEDVKKMKLSGDISDLSFENSDDTDKDIDYQPGKQEESSGSDIEESSKFFRGPKRNVKLGTTKTDFKFKSYMDLSESSSDEEFGKVPESIKDVVKSSNNDSEDSDPENDIKPEQNTYFDFTQIMQRQELIKSVKEHKNEKESGKQKEKRHKNTAQLDVMELLQQNERFDDNDTKEKENEEQEETKNVEVRIELPNCHKKKDKKPDIEAALKRRFNNIKKENQVYAHKVHLLCWIAYGNYLNTILSDQDLLGTALSLIPSKYCYPPKRCDLQYLENLVEWYVGKMRVSINPRLRDKKITVESIKEQLYERKANANRDLVVIFVCLTRALGLTSRLIISLQPVPLKPPVNELFKVTTKPNDKAEELKNCEKPKPPRKNASKYFKDSKKNGKEPKSKSEESSQRKSKRGSKKKEEKGESSDGDFLPKKARQNQSNMIDRSILSPDDEDQKIVKKRKDCTDEWVEVFLEAEEKWISCDLSRGQIHSVKQLYSSASLPVTYVLGWENDRSIKDLTRRYVPHWMTVTRKLRIDPDWWEEALRPFAPPKNARHREEDEDLDKQMEELAMPTTVADFKNHPLYILRRHLLKFQAIYPSDAPTLGFCRGEAIYPRSCLVELHTRESWIKEAKVVRLGEEPYKIVKARPKYDKMTGQTKNDLPLPLFGFWQVEDYIPPPAVDGKVPRNEYGNVEMYKPCMLPGGTVHLQLPGLFRVAKKLNIDCAPAVVGWHFHGGGSAPILDGFIVCEEFKDTLLDAWNQETDNAAKRAQEKLEQRVYGNWKRLIKGLLIREKLKLKYGFNEEDEAKEGKTKKDDKKQQKTTKRCSTKSKKS